MPCGLAPDEGRVAIGCHDAAEPYEGSSKLMFSEPVKDLIMIAVGASLFLRTYVDLRRGVAHTIWASYPRGTRPTVFWTIMIFLALAAIAAVIAGIAGLLLE